MNQNIRDLIYAKLNPMALTLEEERVIDHLLLIASLIAIQSTLFFATGFFPPTMEMTAICSGTIIMMLLIIREQAPKMIKEERCLASLAKYKLPDSKNTKLFINLIISDMYSKSRLMISDDVFLDFYTDPEKYINIVSNYDLLNDYSSLGLVMTAKFNGQTVDLPENLNNI